MTAKIEAYLVASDASVAVTIDHTKAIEYATRHRGVVHHLVRSSEVDRLRNMLGRIAALAADPSNLPLIREALANELSR